MLLLRAFATRSVAVVATTAAATRRSAAPLCCIGAAAAGPRREQHHQQQRSHHPQQQICSMSSPAAAAAAAAAAAGAAGGDTPTAAAGSSAAAPPTVTPASAVDFFTLLTRLKTTKRTGWVRSNVAAPESIADHMYRMAMMALVAGDTAGAGPIDTLRCVKLALVHDVAEAIVGDITPHCGVSEGDKHAREAAAIERIQDMLGRGTAVGERRRAGGRAGDGGCMLFRTFSDFALDTSRPHSSDTHALYTTTTTFTTTTTTHIQRAAAEVAALWHEYEAQATPEAKLLKDLDKLEMVAQAAEYEAAQPGLDLQQFFDSTAGRFSTATGRAWAAEVVRRREAARAARAAAGGSDGDAGGSGGAAQ